MRNIFFIFVFTLLVSCNTQKDVVYMQDKVINTEIELAQGGDIRLKPNDIISIIVSSKDPELALLFNLPKSQLYVTNGSRAGLSGVQGEVLGYTVDKDGNIDYPVLGLINVKGMTKLELSKYIKSALIEKGLVKDPIVTVDFVNLNVSVLGDVANPGRYAITRDQTTIFDALSMAGDLNITGQRDKVFLTRKNDGKIITYQLDLKSADVYNSPAFFVQQDDMIYVEPNTMRANQSTVNANTFTSASFWMSLTSLITTLVVLIVN